MAAGVVLAETRSGSGGNGEYCGSIATILYTTLREGIYSPRMPSIPLVVASVVYSSAQYNNN